MTKGISSAFWLVLVLLAVLGLWEAFKYQIVPKRFGTVERSLIFRSGRIAPRLIAKTLRERNIAVIVDLTEPSPDDPAWRAEREEAGKLGIQVLNFSLAGDGTGNITNYAKAVAAIVEAKRANKPVLVHCSAGAQRTGGVIAAYRLLVEKQLPETVLAEMSRYGWKARRNRALVDYLNKHMPELRSLLQDMGAVRRERSAPPRLAI